MTSTGLSAAHLSTRGVIALSGADRQTFLQSVITNDSTLLTPGQPLYAALLTPQGKYLHDFILVADGERILLDVEAARRADLIRRLTLYRMRSKVEISDLSAELAVVALWGDAVGTQLPANAVRYADPRLGALGERAIMTQADLAALPLGDEAAYDRYRLGYGIPDGAADFEVERTLILEGNLDALNGVSFTKGCYVGQELTARTKHRGKVRKRLLPVTVAGPLPEPDTPILKDEREIGTLRSGRGGRAMALLRVEDISFGAAYPCGAATVVPERPDWLPAEWLTAHD